MSRPVLAAVLGTAVACQSLVGIEDTSIGNSAGGSGGLGATGGASGAGGVGGSGGSGGDASLDGDLDAAVEADAPVVIDCDAGVQDDASVGVCPGNVMYVSDETGSDSNSGCSPCFPKATIGAALASLELATSPDGGGATLPPGFALHVCKGEYVEVGLVLDQPVSLLGGYDCATWSRSAGYGWPAFDKQNEAIVRNGNAATQDDSLRVTGASVDANVTIDGFTFRGWDAAAPPTNAVALGIYTGASPTISNNLVEGGASAGSGSGSGLTNIASTGLWIADASPDVFHNQIHGGSGTDADYGSVGVLVRGSGAAPKVHENEIHGGTGQGQDDGSVGLRVLQGPTLTVAGGNPITGNEIWSGSGMDGSLFGGSAIGVSIESSAELIANRIHGEAYAAQSGIVAGVRIGGAGVVARNQIQASANSATTSTSVGVWVLGSGARLENNMIHSGSAGQVAMGVWLKGTTSVSILHNTIYTGNQPGSPSDLSSIYFEGAATTTIRGNLLLAHADESVTGLRAIDCLNTSMIAALDDNAFIGFDSLATLEDGACPGSINNLSALQNPIKTQGSASGNIRYTSPGVCSLEIGCLELAACAGTAGSTTGCMTLLFSSWSAADDGAGALLSGGWTLKTNSAPCPIAKAIAAPSVPIDLYGASRTNPSSRGAHELEGPCN